MSFNPGQTGSGGGGGGGTTPPIDFLSGDVPVPVPPPPRLPPRAPNNDGNDNDNDNNENDDDNDDDESFEEEGDEEMQSNAVHIMKYQTKAFPGMTLLADEDDGGRDNNDDNNNDQLPPSAERVRANLVSSFASQQPQQQQQQQQQHPVVVQQSNNSNNDDNDDNEEEMEEKVTHLMRLQTRAFRLITDPNQQITAPPGRQQQGQGQGQPYRDVQPPPPPPQPIRQPQRVQNQNDIRTIHDGGDDDDESFEDEMQDNAVRLMQMDHYAHEIGFEKGTHSATSTYKDVPRGARTAAGMQEKGKNYDNKVEEEENDDDDDDDVEMANIHDQLPTIEQAKANASAVYRVGIFRYFCGRCTLFAYWRMVWAHSEFHVCAFLRKIVTDACVSMRNGIVNVCTFLASTIRSIVHRIKYLLTTVCISIQWCIRSICTGFQNCIQRCIRSICTGFQNCIRAICSAIQAFFTNCDLSTVLLLGILLGLVAVALLGFKFMGWFQNPLHDQPAGVETPPPPLVYPRPDFDGFPQQNENPGPQEPALNPIEAKLRSIAIFQGAEFDDPNSYQSAALRSFLSRPDLYHPHFPTNLLQELYALFCFYFSTGGPTTWKISNKDAWPNMGYQPCSWHGVVCMEHTIVRKIELIDEGLTGTLPIELTLLAPHLEEITLDDNPRMSGEIPAFLAALQLKSLSLRNCGFSGNVPQDMCEYALSNRYFILEVDCERVMCQPWCCDACYYAP